ncbi:transcriptional regulator PAI 2-type [Lentinula lateritia]|uniref:Transcriptional regulator PAI 2-type n=1 Tax=Lentinula lateritia TaxID=40482 RepID=A0ABQ8VPR9_9AGAR|nr:transcriptional regulator PAI 2-type [Lentinula lateritia]
MYLRPIHTSHDIPALHDFIRENPLGIFTTALDAPPHAFIQASHIPWVLDVDDPSDLGTLRGHIARANPQAKAIIHTLNINNPPTPLLPSQTMILFNNPHHHYITPKFYTSTKPTTGKVVPTWNYAAVQVYGEARVYYLDDEETSRFLDAQLRDLSDQEESKISLRLGEGNPWKVSDAPASYVNTLKKGIIGIEIRIQSIAGKYKMSQELGRGDRDGVVQGMVDLGDETAIKVAEMVKERGELVS